MRTIRPQRKRARLQDGRRALRVFVSSTFRDLRDERDLLAKHVFPLLRRELEQRLVSITDVDLRWGITSEEAAEGDVIPICFDEIARSDVFIGILAGRYGHIPESLPASTLSEYPWLHAFHGRSVTELEFRLGALEGGGCCPHAFFYLRSPATPVTHEASPTTESMEAEALLAVLRKEVDSADRTTRTYETLEQLRALVHADLTGLFEGLVPTPALESYDAHESLTQAQRAFATAKASGAANLRAVDHQLDRACAEDGHPIVLIGEAGVGKSTVLAQWARTPRTNPSWLSRIRSWFGGSASNDLPLVLTYHIEACPRGTDVTAMMRWLAHELAGVRGAAHPSSLGDQEAAHSEMLEQLRLTAATRRVVVVVDGIDALEGTLGDLAWVPDGIRSVRFILAARPGATSDAARRLEWPVVQLASLTPDDAKRLLTRHLENFGKRLPAMATHTVGSSGLLQNPMLLTTVAEELRMSGTHETLAHELDVYGRAESATQLMVRILTAIQQDNRKAGLPGSELALIWVSRRGLSEPELRGILADDATPIPARIWHQARARIGALLLDRGGLMDIAYPALSEALSVMHASTAEGELALRRRVARYFARQPVSPRSTEERLWQLFVMKDWAGLLTTLTSIEELVAVWNYDPSAVLRYWTALSRHCGTHPDAEYARLLAKPDVDELGALVIATILGELGLVAPAERAFDALRMRFTVTRNAAWRRAASALARNLLQGGKFDSAVSVLQDLAASVPAAEWREQQRLCGYLAMALWERDAPGDAERAQALHTKEIRLCEEHEDRLGAAIGRLNSLRIARRPNARVEAIEVRRLAAVFRRAGHTRALQAALANEATLLREQGDLSGARERFSEATQLAHANRDRTGLLVFLRESAEVETDAGNFDGALAILDELDSLSASNSERERLLVLAARARLGLHTGDTDQAHQLAIAGLSRVAELPPGRVVRNAERVLREIATAARTARTETSGRAR